MNLLTGNRRFLSLVAIALLLVGLFFVIGQLTGDRGQRPDESELSEVTVVGESFERSDELAAALFRDVGLVSGVSVASPDANAAIGFSTEQNGADPNTLETRLVLSNGVANKPDSDDTSSGGGETLSDGIDESRDAFDVTVIKVDFDVPSGVNCLAIPHLQFASNESTDMDRPPTDGFVLELDRSTWTASAATSSNEAGSLQLGAGQDNGLDARFGAGLGFAVATPELRTAMPVDPGAHTLYLSIYDAENSVVNSAAFIGGLDLVTVGESEGCATGAKLADRSQLVALGDSNAAGFGLPPFAEGTGSSGNDCQRSSRSYPAQLAEVGDYQLRSVACSGATTSDLFTRNAGRGEPAQFESLQTDTGVVVLSIGVNDASWSDALQTCVLESVFGSPCENNSEVNARFDQVLARLAGDAVEPPEVYPYGEIFAEIRRRSPYADIVAVMYPQLFPAEGGEAPGLLGGNRCAGLLKSDQRWINGRSSELVEAAMSQASESDVAVVDPSAAFAGHALCENPSWIMGLNEPGPLHATEAGHAAMAELILAEVGGG